MRVIQVILVLLSLTQISSAQIYIQPDSSLYEDGSNKCIISNQDSGWVSSAPVNSGSRWLSAYTTIYDNKLVFTIMAYDGYGKTPRKCDAIIMLWGVTSYADTVLLEKSGYFCGEWKNYIAVDWNSLCLRGNDFMRLFLTVYTEGENCRNKGEICVGGDGMSTSDYRLGEKFNGRHGARFGNPQSFDGWLVSKKPWTNQRSMRARRVLKKAKLSKKNN